MIFHPYYMKPAMPVTAHGRDIVRKYDERNAAGAAACERLLKDATYKLTADPVAA